MPRRRPTPATTPGSEPSPPDPASPNAAGFSTRDILIPYVLLAVSLQRAHGELIEEYLRGVGFFSLEMSTLYRTLRQLEKDGLLDSTWEPGPTGPARRVYSLTDVGRGWLDQWANTLGKYRRMLDQFFGLYAGNGQPKEAEPR
jgi:PadR family transcriptional regulator PadR